MPTTDPATPPVTDLAEYVRHLVDAWPPLTPEQRDRLAVLLRPPAQNGARAA